MPVGMAIVTREFPPQQRGIALGFWAISAAASVSFGPLIGGYLVDNFSWSLIFDVNVPFGILAMLVTIVIQKEFINKHVKAFDVIGFISVSIFLPFLLYALTEGSAQSNTQGLDSSVYYHLFCNCHCIFSGIYNGRTNSRSSAYGFATVDESELWNKQSYLVYFQFGYVWKHILVAFVFAELVGIYRYTVGSCFSSCRNYSGSIVAHCRGNCR